MHILAGDCIVFSRGNLKSERRRSEKAVAPFSFSLSLSLSLFSSLTLSSSLLFLCLLYLWPSRQKVRTIHSLFGQLLRGLLVSFTYNYTLIGS